MGRVQVTKGFNDVGVNGGRASLVDCLHGAGEVIGAGEAGTATHAAGDVWGGAGHGAGGGGRGRCDASDGVSDGGGGGGGGGGSSG
jgi:hypothetical protein